MLSLRKDLVFRRTARRTNLSTHEFARPSVVRRDGPGNWHVPTTVSHFNQLGLAVPDYLWDCQEHSGSLINSIGSSTIELARNATGHLYRQTVTGWQRKFLGTDDTTAGQSWRTSSALLDLAAGESVAMICLASVAASASGTRALMLWGSTTGDGLWLTSPGTVIRPIFNNFASAASGTVNHADLATVRQFCVYRNATTNVSGAVTNLDAVTTTHYEGAITGQVKGMFGGSTGMAARIGWYAIFKGANAERDWAAYLTALRG